MGKTYIKIRSLHEIGSLVYAAHKQGSHWQLSPQPQLGFPQLHLLKDFILDVLIFINYLTGQSYHSKAGCVLRDW